MPHIGSQEWTAEVRAAYDVVKAEGGTTSDLATRLIGRGGKPPSSRALLAWLRRLRLAPLNPSLAKSRAARRAVEANPEHYRKALPAKGIRTGMPLKQRQLRGARATHAVRDAKDPSWRLHQGQTTRKTVHRVMSRRHGPKWRIAAGRLGGKSLKGKPKSGAHRAALRSRHGRLFYEVRTRLSRGHWTPNQLLILEDQVRADDAAAQLVRAAIQKYPGPQPAYTLAELRKRRDDGQSAKQIAAVLDVSVQHARRLLRLI